VVFAFLSQVGCTSLGHLWPSSSYSITVLETNDIHSNLFPWKHKDASGHVCEVGGFARIAAIVDEARKTEPNVLVLDAGDRFYPNSLAKWRGEPEMVAMNMIGYDCATLGNHEFDLGDELLGAALDQARFPFVCANIDVSGSPPLAGKIERYVIKEVGGHSIGIFGLITPSLRSVSHPSPQVEVERDLAAQAWEMVAYLSPRTELVFALTHIGLGPDVKLAESVSGIDVIFGGHTHDALTEPIEAQNPIGETTLVVQSGCYGRYVGRLRLDCSADGVSSYNWSLREVGEAVKESERVASFLLPFRPAEEESIGIIDADLDLLGESAATPNSTIGTLVCEAMAEAFPTAAVVMTNSGGIRGNFQPAGPITRSRIDEILPFHNKMVLVWVKGAELKSILERSVCALPESSGGFLQMLGLEVEVDLSKPAMLTAGKGKPVRPGERIAAVSIAGKPLDEQSEYVVATINYLADGGDGYVEFAAAVKRVETGASLNDIFKDYVIRHTPLRPRRASTYRFVKQQ
ncbi:MAG: bifunctional metallophosphatase/5'-nucleotidase, partial [Candidatus Coatesbacteria bacterium]|nr:bifunctional metallophosphatase/5'-nucleotidase [Candidatus Coatesbacteria bacterium]